jgi:hypothetical protein
MRSFVRLVLTVVVFGAVAVSAGVGTADAGRPRPVGCVGTVDYCGAAISIGGATQSRVVTINLTGRNVKLASMTTVPASSRWSFLISQSSYRRGGSQFRFRLSTTRTNPRRARLILTFAAGGRAGKLGGVVPGLRDQRVEGTATFSIGFEKTVEITPEGGDCTRDERGAKFVTKIDNESHTFGFTTRTDGVCFIDASWSDFYVKVTDSAGDLVGDGTIRLGPLFGVYIAFCPQSGGLGWDGLVCEDVGTGLRGVKIRLLGRQR